MIQLVDDDTLDFNLRVAINNGWDQIAIDIADEMDRRQI